MLLRNFKQEMRYSDLTFKKNPSCWLWREGVGERGE
jgi:hypothetical protein